MSTSVEAPPPPPAVTPAAPRSGRSRARMIVERITPFGSLIVLVAMVAYFAYNYYYEFWTKDNLIALLSDGAPLAIVAGGLTVALISLDFDLSVGAMATLSGLTLALLLGKSVPLGLAILMVLALGVIVGLVNGFVVVKLGVSAFIGTLAVMSILGGLSTWWASGASVNVTDVTFTGWATDMVWGLPYPLILAIVFYFFLWFVLERTTIGRRIYAVGANAEAARLGGFNVARLRMGAFVICAVGATVVGLVLTSKLFGAYQNAGDTLLLDSYAAVFLGAVTIRLGQFHILGTAVGVLILSVLSNGLSIIGTEAYVGNLIKGGILVAAVAIAGTSGTLKRMVGR
jgi:ribose transport system permease protein